MTTASRYQQFQARRQLLADLIARSRAGFDGLEMAAWAETADRLAARVASDRFRVMILGEFKRGKSTFINALLGAEVLPADIAPCTAVINEVKWGDERRALVHFRHPPPERSSPLPADARRHLDGYRGGAAPPMEVGVADLAEFVKIPDPGADQAASVAESPLDRVEVFWPLPLCRDGVEIIDSPGLNEHHTRTKTTRDYLTHIDAVVFVFSVHNLAGESELNLVDHDLRAAGHEYLFFVCNRFDELRRQDDRDKIRTYAFARLAERTRFGREGVYFLSALDALDGRLMGDEAIVSRSGIGPLEKALEKFLVEDRGRVKLRQPASQLARGLHAALAEVVPARRALLDKDLASLRKLADEARPHLQLAERKRDGALRQVEAARQRVRDAVRAEAERFFSELSQDVPLWARRMETKAAINPITVWSAREQADGVAREVLGRLQPAVEESLQRWEQSRLRPLLARQMQELAEDLDASLEPFLTYLDTVKGKLQGGFAPAAYASGDLMSVERVLAGAGGALLGAGLVVAASPGIGAAVSAVGITGVVTAVAAKVGALLLSMVNPITFGAVVCGALALNHRRGTALTNQVKLQVAEGVAAQLRSEAGSRAAAIADEVFTQTDELANAIAEGLDRELRAANEQVESVLRHKEESEAKVERERGKMTLHENAMREVGRELNELLESLG